MAKLVTLRKSGKHIISAYVAKVDCGYIIQVDMKYDREYTRWYSSKNDAHCRITFESTMNEIEQSHLDIQLNYKITTDYCMFIRQDKAQYTILLVDNKMLENMESV